MDMTVLRGLILDFVDNQGPIHTTMLSSCAGSHVVLYSTSFKLANLQCQNIVSFRVSLNPEFNAFGKFDFWHT